ncbi:MAG: Tim44 domain-containing protein [Magnetospirillum sp.]|nr:MAG: Tim44 domain-containing protein [Magnetospirillum sp.]
MKRIILSVLVALTLAFAGGGDALAKAGSTSKSSGGSMGSKGSRTYDAPMERSLTPPTAPSRPAGPPPAPVAPPRPGNVDAAPMPPQMARPGAVSPMGQPMAQPGFFQRNPFMAGLAGGLVGAGIGGMLFGHSPALAEAGAAAPGAGFLGLLLQLALIGGLVWLGVRIFRSRSATPGAVGNPYLRAAPGQHLEPELTAAAAAPRVEKEFDPTAADQQAFTEILQGVQAAWSEGNLVALRRWATPEVVSFLSEDLSRNTSEGLINKVENVVLLKGDVSESWSENGFDYITAVLTFQCVDFMVRADTGAVASGSPTTPVQHTEAWTFVRSASGGRWLLSAVQQV